MHSTPLSHTWQKVCTLVSEPQRHKILIPGFSKEHPEKGHYINYLEYFILSIFRILLVYNTIY